GDVNGDACADLICGAGTGGGPNVAVFSGRDATPLASYFAYNPNFTGGVRVAAGDVTGDGRAEVISGAGSGGGPNVMVHQIVDGQVQALQNYFAFDAELTTGIYVAAADVDGDSRADVI